MNRLPKLSRRSLGALVGAAALAPVAAAPLPQEAQPARADDDVEAAQAIRRGVEAVAKVAVPRPTEPANRFEV